MKDEVEPESSHTNKSHLRIAKAARAQVRFANFLFSLLTRLVLIAGLKAAWIITHKVELEWAFWFGWYLLFSWLAWSSQAYFNGELRPFLVEKWWATRDKPRLSFWITAICGTSELVVVILLFGVSNTVTDDLAARVSFPATSFTPSRSAGAVLPTQARMPAQGLPACLPRPPSPKSPAVQSAQ